MSAKGKLERVLEPEVMDTAEEARDYDAVDHEAVKARFCDDLFALAIDVADGVAPLGVPSAVRLTSDRHWTLAWQKP